MAFSKLFFAGILFIPPFFGTPPRRQKKREETQSGRSGRLRECPPPEEEEEEKGKEKGLIGFPFSSLFHNARRFDQKGGEGLFLLLTPIFPLTQFQLFPPLCWTTQQRTAHCSTKCALYLFPLTHIPHGQLLLFFFVLGSHLEIERLSDTKAVPPRWEAEGKGERHSSDSCMRKKRKPFLFPDKQNTVFPQSCHTEKLNFFHEFVARFFRCQSRTAHQRPTVVYPPPWPPSGPFVLGISCYCSPSLPSSLFDSRLEDNNGDPNIYQSPK